MSPASPSQSGSPAASSLADRVAVSIGAAIADERRRRRWTARHLATRARVAAATVTNIEAGRCASLDRYARLAVALGRSLELGFGLERRSVAREPGDVVHAAMGELEATWLAARAYQVAIDQPYQHYQFAGRADVIAWTRQPPRLLHIENRTRFPDLQAMAGSYNAKRRYLAPVLGRDLGVGTFGSVTHVVVALWSAEVIHAIRLRPASFSALCPDGGGRFADWIAGRPPDAGATSSLVLLDPLASGRQARTADLDRVMRGLRPRVRDYRDAARRLGSRRPRPWRRAWTRPRIGPGRPGPRRGGRPLMRLPAPDAAARPLSRRSRP